MAKEKYTEQLLHALELQSQGKYDDALDCYHRLIKKRDNEVVRNNFGFLLLQKGDAQNALVQFEAALNFNPQYIPALCNKALALWAHNKINEAVNSLLFAYQAAPDDLEVNINLAKIMMALGKFRESENFWTNVLTIEPAAGHLADYVEMLMAANNHAHAKKLIQSNMTMVEQSAKLIALSGMINYIECNYGEAIVNFKKALGLEPENADIRNSLASAFLKCNDRESAMLEYKRILMLSPDSYTVLNNLAVLELSAGEIDTALRSFNIVLKHVPANVKALYYKGVILFQKDKINEAQKILNKVIVAGDGDYKLKASQLLASINQEINTQTK